MQNPEYPNASAEQRPPMKETVDLRAYLQLLWRRKWLVIVPTLLAGIAGIVVTMPRIMKPVYSCSAALMVELPTQLNRQLEPFVTNPSLQERLMRMETQIQSADFLNSVIDATGMRNDTSTRNWAEKNQKKYPDLTVDELVELRLHRTLRQVIRVRAEDDNRIIVQANDYDPGRCYRLVSNLVVGIIEANRRSQTAAIRVGEEFGQTQLLDAKRELDEAEARLERFRRGQASRSVTPGLVGPDNLSEADELRRQARADIARFGGQATQAAGQGMGVSSQSLDAKLRSGALGAVVSRGENLEREYVRQSLLGASRDQSPENLAIQLARLVSEARAAAAQEAPNPAALDYLAASVQMRLAQTRAAELDREIRKYQGSVTSMPGASLEENRLVQEVEQARRIFEAFEQQITTAQFSLALEESSAGEKISVIDPPQHPLKPVKPRRTPMIILSFIGGLVLGVLGAFVLEQHDQSLRDIKETEERIGVRVVGTIPELEGIASDGRDPDKQRAAFERFLADSPGYQEFRKSALALLRYGNESPSSILLTSARSEEGKSTASVCLALTMAKELSDERIALVDMDARRPTVAAKIGLEVGESHVGTILQRREWNESVGQTWIRPNLTILPMVRDEEVGECITTDRVRWFLDELGNRFDRVIIDSPPNLPVPDPLVIGPEVDAVLIVVKAGVTPREMVRRSVEMQKEFRDNLAGVLLNDVTSALPYYYSYKSYGYNYSNRKQARG